jgi:uronate dehydrogenase
MARSRLLLTGAAGGIGGVLAPHLRERYDVVLLDRVAPAETGGLPVVIADIADADAMAEAMSGCDAVVHMAGNRFPTATWPELVTPNLVGGHTVLSVAADVGVRRVVFASSCHASGQHDVEHIAQVDPRWAARPCCGYGATKVYGESVGRLIADTTDTSVVALRLGAVAERPYFPVAIPFWLSLGDLLSLVDASLTADVRYGVYYGGSANARERWNLQLGVDEIGYVPQDDSADHLDNIDYSVTGALCYAGAA